MGDILQILLRWFHIQQTLVNLSQTWQTQTFPTTLRENTIQWSVCVCVCVCNIYPSSWMLITQIGAWIAPSVNSGFKFILSLLGEPPSHATQTVSALYHLPLLYFASSHLPSLIPDTQYTPLLWHDCRLGFIYCCFPKRYIFYLALKRCAIGIQWMHELVIELTE